MNKRTPPPPQLPVLDVVSRLRQRGAEYTPPLCPLVLALMRHGMTNGVAQYLHDKTLSGASERNEVVKLIKYSVILISLSHSLFLSSSFSPSHTTSAEPTRPSPPPSPSSRRSPPTSRRAWRTRQRKFTENVGKKSVSTD